MNRKRYIDQNGRFWDGSSLTIGGMLIVNPTEEQLLEAGYTEYVEPEPTAEELLERAKQEKLWEIEEYDRSENVNSFFLGEQQMWLTVEERQQIATQISANEAIGREYMTKWFGGNEYTFPIAQWKQMLVALEVYAGDALNVTEAHKAAVQAMDNIEDIEAYDITLEYPEKLTF